MICRVIVPRFRPVIRASAGRGANSSKYTGQGQHWLYVHRNTREGNDLIYWIFYLVPIWRSVQCESLEQGAPTHSLWNPTAALILTDHPVPVSTSSVAGQHHHYYTKPVLNVSGQNSKSNCPAKRNLFKTVITPEPAASLVDDKCGTKIRTDRMTGQLANY